MAPQFLQSILDGRARKREARACIESMCGASDLTFWVLNGLGFVEHDDVPGGLREQLDVMSQQGVARDRDSGLGVESSVGAVVQRNRETRTEAFDFSNPAMKHGSRRDNERSPFEGTECLKRFTKTHVIGEQRAEFGTAQEDEPVDTVALIWAQYIDELGIDWRSRDAVEAFEKRSQAFERRRRRLVQVFAQEREIRECVSSDSASWVTGGEKVSDAVAVKAQPVGGQLRESATIELDHGFTTRPSTQYGLRSRTATLGLGRAAQTGLFTKGRVVVAAARIFAVFACVC